MSRLFISHSNRDNVEARAFKQWLGANGWPDEDVFLDLDDIGAGERWKEALRSANARCEAVVLLASPNALASAECLAEVRKAEDYGKEIVVVILRDIKLSDHRLDSYKDRQIVDLTSAPRTHVEIVQHRGEQYEIRFNQRALASILEYLIKRGITPNHFAWPPADRMNADPFPGLSAFTEDDAGIFFGRDADILRGLDCIRVIRRNGRPRVMVIEGSSGAGKSSYLRAGLWPRLERDSDFALTAILRPARGILTGPDGLGGKLANRLSRAGKPINPGDIHAQLMDPDAANVRANFSKLMVKVLELAHDQRRIIDEQARKPALLLAIDQAEELFAAEDEVESKRFLLLITQFLRNPPEGVDPFVILTIRADRAASIYQTVSENDLEFAETLPLLPLPRTSYRDVIFKPLELIARRGQRLAITPQLAERLIADSKGADALPLLAFTLSHLYREFGAGGTIAIEQYELMGGVSGAIDVALGRALAKPKEEPSIPATREEQLACVRAAFIPWLAFINPESGIPMRRVARTEELPSHTLNIVERLVGARLLVADRHSGFNVVEIAHESLLRQWSELFEWLKADAEDLKLLETVVRSALEWIRKDRQDDWLDHRGARLRGAERVANRQDFRKRLGEEGAVYLRACRKEEQRREYRLGAFACGVLLVVLVSVLSWWYQQELKEDAYWFAHVRPYLLTKAREKALAPLDTFRECTNCPEMVVVPIGSFVMGSAIGQGEKSGREYPAHRVTIAEPLAVSKFELSFAEWDACADNGSCGRGITAVWGRDRQPVVNVTWRDAHEYVAWLARLTGKPYRLLSEAEYEYAARAGTQTAYPWGNAIGSGNANCGECGSQWDGGQTAPVGSFAGNRFGLHDMVGNVFEWVEDCYHDNYNGAPSNGTPWLFETCPRRIVRGGAWLSHSDLLRSASRDWINVDNKKDYVGFRVARTLSQQ